MEGAPVNLNTAAANIIRLEALKDIVVALRGEGLEPLVLKGAALAETVYPSIARRPMCDADLLIPPGSGSRVTACLRALGYRPQTHETMMFADHPRYPLRLDVHEAIWYMPPADTAALWTYATPFSLAGVPARTLPPDEHLIFIAAHAAVHHGRLTPQALEDIRQLCRHYAREMNWSALVAKIGRYRLRAPLGLIFAAARETGAPIPEGVLAGLRPATRGEARLAALFQRVFRQPPMEDVGHLLQLLLCPGLRGKLTHLARMLFPSRAFIVRRYGVAGPLAVTLYQVGRPALLLGALVRFVWRWLIRPSAAGG